MIDLKQKVVNKAAEILKREHNINTVITNPVEYVIITEENFDGMVEELINETLFQVNQLRGW